MSWSTSFGGMRNSIYSSPPCALAAPCSRSGGASWGGGPRGGTSQLQACQGPGATHTHSSSRKFLRVGILVPGLQTRNHRLRVSHDWYLTQPGNQPLLRPREAEGGSPGPETHCVDGIVRRLLLAVAGAWVRGLRGGVPPRSPHLLLWGKESGLSGPGPSGSHPTDQDRERQVVKEATQHLLPTLPKGTWQTPPRPTPSYSPACTGRKWGRPPRGIAHGHKAWLGDTVPGCQGPRLRS